jgi:predicted MFS family arabinose efflux permease
MLGDYIQAFNCTLAEAVQFIGVCILVLGFSNFLWVPISSSFGRRPVLLFSSAVCLGSCIWRARSNTYGSFMGACVLNGIGAG